MLLTVVCGHIVTQLEVSAELRLDSVVEVARAEAGLKGEHFVLSCGGRVIGGAALGRTIAEVGLSDGDVIVLTPGQSSLSPCRPSSDNNANHKNTNNSTGISKLDRDLAWATENLPEAFVPVSMLYIRVKVNGHEMKAFIDTGAQVSILSERAASMCGLRDLVDHRWNVTANGVGGNQKALGRIMKCDLSVGDHSMYCSLVVLPGDGPGQALILGLDMMRRHDAVIDNKNQLISFNSGQATAPFLSDQDAAKCGPLFGAGQ